jgi:hypothetical protein
MVDVTIWLEKNYPENSTCIRNSDIENCSSGNAKNRSQITNLDISNQDLEGNLNITNFNSLQKLNASFNKLNNW